MAYFGCGRKALLYKGFSEVKVARTTALWAIVCKQILLVLIPLSLQLSFCHCEKLPSLL